MGGKVRGWAEDYPARVNLALVLLVAAQAVSTLWTDALDLPSRIISHSSPEARSAFAVESAAVAGVVAGFAGVIVIFGLSTDTARFKLLRMKGAERLAANWTSIVSVSLLGAFGLVTAGALVMAGSNWVALWTVEGALLITAHGALRLVWLLRSLASVVAAQDDDANNTEDEVSHSDVFSSL
jgi:hypothetical protein